ncbi:hypothetical protein EXIGLDRAFT_765405 [Exidia glandulosa HHB12029]|uniref:Uncharacterized protein n=1 Tax=Exidia glandulosa HHB12029 TaxID=1314781 RepID=A0A165KGJ1_EXIGL|nr:hypothetical protein EXIGLDRAFT_765405 [Exidia glandulosa HHB12029]
MAPAPEKYIDEQTEASRDNVWPAFRNEHTAATRAGLDPFHGARVSRVRDWVFRARPAQPWHRLRPYDRLLVDSSTRKPVTPDKLPPDDGGVTPAPTTGAGSGWAGSGWGEAQGTVDWAQPFDNVVRGVERWGAAAAAADEATGWGAPAGATSGWEWVNNGGNADNGPASRDSNDSMPQLVESDIERAPRVAPAPAPADAPAPAPLADVEAVEAATGPQPNTGPAPNARTRPIDVPPRTTRIPSWGQRYESAEEFRDRVKEEYVVAQETCAKTNKDCRPRALCKDCAQLPYEERWAAHEECAKTNKNCLRAFPCEDCYGLPGAAWFLAGETFVDEYVDDMATECGSVCGTTPPPRGDVSMATMRRELDVRMWYRRQEREVGERYPMFG